jgi:branched-chain amino acid transport system ATP-binding protein
MTLLAVRALTVRYEGLVAVDGVDLEVPEGAIAGLIGPNGAGKSTLIDAVTGFTPAAGHVSLAGRALDDLPPHQRARAGLARTFQSLELFDDLTVEENLAVAAARPAWWATLADGFRPSPGACGAVRWALEALEVAELAGALPSELPNGPRHLVAIARAVVARPRLVLLDEPAAGLDERETDLLAAALRRLPDLGIAVLLVDHDMGLVLGICDVVHVLDVGRLIASGPPEAVRADEAVITAYLGAPPERGDGT